MGEDLIRLEHFRIVKFKHPVSPPGLDFCKLAANAGYK